MAANNFLGAGLRPGDWISVPLEQLGEGTLNVMPFVDPIPAMNAQQPAPQQTAFQVFQAFLERRQVDANAVAKANRLLRKFLTPDQLDEYKETGRITIINGKKKYTIGRDLLVRLYDIDDYALAPPHEVWCVRLPGTPISDSLLAQLLLIRSNPAKLRKMACITSGRARANSRARALEMIRRAGYVG